jgi:hypothetical protein
MKYLFYLLLIAVGIATISAFNHPDEGYDTVTVYTQIDIYYLKGRVIETESGDAYIYGTREKAVNALEDLTAIDANTTIELVLLSDTYSCDGEAINEDAIIEILVEPWAYDKISISSEGAWDNDPLTVIKKYESLGRDLMPLLYDY